MSITRALFARGLFSSISSVLHSLFTAVEVRIIWNGVGLSTNSNRIENLSVSFRIPLGEVQAGFSVRS